MSNVISVDDSDFDSVVLNSEVPVLVDFSATWCGPCQKQHIILQKYANETLGKVKIVQLDIEDAHKTAARYSIKSIPTLMLFVGGQSVGSQVGLTSFGELSNFMMTKVGASLFTK
jgi:thioredoxin 1